MELIQFSNYFIALKTLYAFSLSIDCSLGQHEYHKVVKSDSHGALIFARGWQILSLFISGQFVENHIKLILLEILAFTLESV